MLYREKSDKKEIKREKGLINKIEELNPKIY